MLRIAARVDLVAVPLLSFGYLTGPAFVFAAVRLRSRQLAVAAALYLTVTVVACGLSQREMNSTLNAGATTRRSAVDINDPRTPATVPG
jgi:hypothetical protein